MRPRLRASIGLSGAGTIACIVALLFVWDSPDIVADLEVSSIRVISNGSFEVSATSEIELLEMAIAVRQGPYEDHALPAGFRIAAPRILIEEFRLNRTSVQTSSAVGNHSVVLPPKVAVSRFTLEHAELFLSHVRHDAAIVLEATSSSVLWNEAPVRFTGQVRNPLLRDSASFHDDFSKSHPDEFGKWVKLGDYLMTFQPPDVGRGSGRIHAYWTNAVVVAKHNNGTLVLDGNSNSESAPVPTATRTKDIVWYEARVTEGDFTFSASRNSKAHVVLLASALDGKAAWVSVDSFRAVDGLSFEGVARAGSSVWIEGDLDVRVQAAKSSPENAQTQAEGPETYGIFISGNPRQVSFGGSSATGLDHVEMVGAGLALILLGLVVSLREAVLATISKAFFIGYTKLRKERLFNVRARDEIYRAIQASPGIHFLALHRSVLSARGGRIAFGALAYHLSQMERFELIVSKRAGRFRRYFDVASRIGADAGRIALLQTHPVPIVARVVWENPNLSQAALHHKLLALLPVRRQTLAYHLKRLVEKELVARESVGRFTRYRPTDRLQRLLRVIVPSESDSPVQAKIAAGPTPLPNGALLGPDTPAGSS